MNNFIKFENKDFEEFVTKEFEKSDKEIFSVNYENKKYWIKRGRKTSSNFFHKLFYKLLPFEVLLPVETKSAKDSILFETNKIRKFESLGINVPKVMGSNENFFVLSDCGRDVYGYLKYSNISQDSFNKYLEKYIKALAKIHLQGQYHGGAQSRNFTVFEEEVFAIDLEDSFNSNVDIKLLQFRDLLLLLLSMSKIKNYEFSYKKIINIYMRESNNKVLLPKLKKLSKSFNFILYFYSIDFSKKIMPRDLKDFCKMIIEIKGL